MFLSDAQRLTIYNVKKELKEKCTTKSFTVLHKRY